MVTYADSGTLIGRVSTALRVLSAANDTGATTSEVARSSSLARPTAHRLLTSLLGEGFVDRDNASGRWFLGPELYLLGASASARYEISSQARPSVLRMAEATGESAFFVARRGDESVCLVREDGSFPIRSFVLYEGARFPLGVVASGLAILAFLPDPEIEEFLSRVDLAATRGPSYTSDAVCARVEQTRRRGYAVNPGLVVEGDWGMAAAVFDETGVAKWALTITGIENRFRVERQEELGKLLLDEAHRLSRALIRQPSRG
ncbi:transcriptional regulator, IclR family [Williamsia sterculiae]|uniref:Transcriptional regulator, IclR family n=1 Tax=Williamsia sterculiae TaxID=1344003 RepID=A0A1N7H266_9NOCA|nr:transcriptional regulator, IclR family [Williamsia sterculiae]